MKRIIHCIGNPAYPPDALALELADELQMEGWMFEKAHSPEELFDENAEELIIMDVAKGIESVTVLSDLSKLQSGAILSLHDFDLSSFLRLMEKMGTLPKLTIIALPMGKRKEEVKKEVVEALREASKTTPTEPPKSASRRRSRDRRRG